MYGVDDALLAELAAQAAAEAAAQTAATAAASTAASTVPAATQAGMGLAESTAPLAAEAPTMAAPEGMKLSQALPMSGTGGGNGQTGKLGDPMASMENISQGDLGKEVMTPIAKVGEIMPSMSETSTNLGNGNFAAEFQNVDMGSRLPGNDLTPGAGDIAVGIFGGGDAPPPMPAPKMLPQQAPTPPPQPSNPSVPMSMQEKMQGAHAALRMAGKLIPNKDAKQTLNLMSLATGMGANGGDMTKNPGSVLGPLNDIASQTAANEQAQKQKLSQATALAPSSVPAPPRPPVSSSAAPATARVAAAPLPPTRMVGGISPEEQLRMLYGG